MIDPPDLDFNLHDTLHLTHGLHAFAAKCPPPLATWGIQHYSDRNESVLDPMAGSGTTLVEGRLLGRHVYGVDLDPVAGLLSKVKATPLIGQPLEEATAHLLARIDADAAAWDRVIASGISVGEANAYLRLDMPAIHNRDYWFLPEVAAKLAIIKRAIGATETTDQMRDFFCVAFSSLIIARTSVANARDLVHSRHHHVAHAQTPQVQALFRQRLLRMQRQMATFIAHLPLDHVRHRTVMYRADARRLPLESGAVDLVFTSPPYCNALDYPRAHQFVIGWLGDVLGVDSKTYTTLARTYIGTDRAPKTLPLDLADAPGNSPTAQRVIREIASVDPVKAAIVQRYFRDMAMVLAEIGRVLRSERHAILVICPSNIRRVSVPSHQVFVEIGDALCLPGGYRFRAVAHHERRIDDRKRLLPYMDDTALAQRMRTEYVIVLQKQWVPAHTAHNAGALA